MFDIGWVELLHPGDPVAPAQTVVVLARTCGLYSLSATRVIAMIDGGTGHVRRRGSVTAHSSTMWNEAKSASASSTI